RGARCRHQRVSPACRALRQDGAAGRGCGDAREARADRAARVWCRRAAMKKISLALLAVMWAAGAPAPEVSFTDVTSSANVAFTNLNGASPDKHLPETMGSGGAFVDLDSDGWVDIVLVDGGSIADPQVARRAQPRVLRNRKHGTLEDVTAASGIRPRAYGLGVGARDIDHDGHLDPYHNAPGT